MSRRHIENCEDEELIFLLGDFNGHIGILGNQQLNYNGKLVMDIKTECDLILLNSTEKCDGTYTWSRGRLAPMCQQSGTLLFCSCHGIAGFLVDELQI